MNNLETDSTCSNNGCKQKYHSHLNTPESCVHHPGKPIFHDLKKGWACCNIIVYDWEEFQKIKGCKTGPHLPKTTSLPGTSNQSEFEKSVTVSRAENSINNYPENSNQTVIKVKNIEDFNKEQEALAALKKVEVADKKVVILPNGNCKCVNKGCNKEFKAEENSEVACNFHKGGPIFHDVQKSWSCCGNGKVTWDWDDFMKIPTCSVGKHVPKVA